MLNSREEIINQIFFQQIWCSVSAKSRLLALFLKFFCCTFCNLLFRLIYSNLLYKIRTPFETAGYDGAWVTYEREPVIFVPIHSLVKSGITVTHLVLWWPLVMETAWSREVPGVVTAGSHHMTSVLNPNEIKSKT